VFFDLFERLRHFDILTHFSDEQIDLLATCTSMVRYSKGSKIISEGDEGSQDIFLIDSGEVEIRRETPFGHYPFARLKAGDVFGETSFVDGHPRSGDAFVAEDAVIFPLNAVAIQRAMEDNPRWALALYWALWKSLSRKLRLTNEVLADFFSGARKKAPSQPAVQQNENFRVGLDKKRDLFREQPLSPMEINFLASLSKEKHFKREEYLFREGQEGDALYIVLEGQIRISKDTAAGEEALAILYRGDYFGEMALIDRQPRSADAKAHSDEVVVLMISREVLEGILDIQKVSSLRLLKLLCGLIAKRLREIDHKLVSWYIFDQGSGETLGMPNIF
jgi:CRP/FNR family cyclic AMP-dependent transcriptional regulator